MPAVLMLVDLDDFKSVNDRRGHAAQLKVIARALNAHVRTSEVGGRLGGAELGMILWNAGRSRS